MKPKNELLFLALGGSGEIGMNVNLYGCNGKWIMVDLGISFSDPHYPGTDLVLPTYGYRGRWHPGDPERRIATCDGMLECRWQSCRSLR